MARLSRAQQLSEAAAKLRVAYDVSLLKAYPGPRGPDVCPPGQPRRKGKHLYWYIGRFEVRPGISGGVRIREAPTFHTEKAAQAFLDALSTEGA